VNFLKHCSSGNIKAVKELSNDHSPEQITKLLNSTCDSSEMYATHLAAEFGHAELLDLILKAGADLFLITCRSNTALHIASRSNKPECVNILMRHANLMWFVVRQLWIALRYPPTQSNLTMLSKDVIGVISTILMADCVSFNKLILMKNNDNFTALECAMKNGAKSVIPLLVSPLTVQQLQGVMGSPLHWAAACGSVETCALLVKFGAPLNAKNERGETALFRACCAYPEAADCVKLLLDAGTDYTLKAKSERTAMDEAAARHYNASVEHIKVAQRKRSGTK